MQKGYPSEASFVVKLILNTMYVYYNLRYLRVVSTISLVISRVPNQLIAVSRATPLSSVHHQLTPRHLISCVIVMHILHYATVKRAEREAGRGTQFWLSLAHAVAESIAAPLQNCAPPQGGLATACNRVSLAHGEGFLFHRS